MPGVRRAVVTSVEVSGSRENPVFHLHFDDTSMATSAPGVDLSYVLGSRYRNTPVDIYTTYGGKVVEVVPRAMPGLIPKRHDMSKTAFERLAEAVWG